tara:strand:- start:409 stop:735 length:327 start_codon:yes stop_codon:yes gene_type:complete
MEKALWTMTIKERANYLKHKKQVDYYKPFLKTLKENTKNNHHSENCLLIAYNFGTNIHRLQAKEIEKEQHRQLGYIPYFVQLARDYLVKDILHNMDNKKLSKEIYKVL